MAMKDLLLAVIFVVLYHSTLVYCLDYCGVPVQRNKPLRHNQLELKQVVVVIRHGDRIQAWPQQCWPGDTAEWDCNLCSASLPTINRDFHQIIVDRIYRKVYMSNREEERGNCGIGQLTLRGYHQELANGKVLRQAYVSSGFLSKQFSPTEVYLRSDDMPRTMQSAQAVALGLYPPIPTPTSSKVEVLNINTMDRTYDDITPNPRLCPMQDKLKEECLKSEAYMKHYNTVTLPLIKDLQNALKTPDLSAEDIVRISDCMLVHKCHNKALPPTVDETLFERVTNESQWMAEFIYSCPNRTAASRVGIGFLMKEIWQIMNDAMEGQTKRKFTLISGHDTTLIPMLIALNVSDGIWPHYASMLQLELYSKKSEENSGFVIRMLYNGKEIKFPYCDDNPCDVTQFSSYIETIIPEDPTTECKVDEGIKFPKFFY